MDITIVSDFGQLRQHLVFRCGLFGLEEEVELLYLVHFWQVLAIDEEDGKGIKY